MSIPSSITPLFSTGAGGYQIERSLRFNSSDSAYLSRTPAVAGNRTTWTWAAWAKIFPQNSNNNEGGLFTGYSDNTNRNQLFVTGSQTIRFLAGGTGGDLSTVAVFRDPSAWYHIVARLDTTAATTFRLYINGVEQTLTGTYPGANTQPIINSANVHYIGALNFSGVVSFFNGYLADVHFIDGQALDATAFTEVSATTGQLIPKTYSGSYGTNGFQLKFADNSSNTAATLGKDTSGNSNNWTPSANISVSGSSNYADYISRFTSGENKYNAFDGSISTYISQDSADGTGITFAPSPTITVTSLLRFYHTTGAPSTKDYKINGGSAVTTPNSGWVSTSFTGTLSSFVLRDNRGAGYSASLYAIEVDGTILVDYRSVSGNDSLVDTPTSYGTDTSGVGGVVRGNYATFNTLILGTSTTTNGNLEGTNPGSVRRLRSTIGASSGKWYWEVVHTGGSAGSIGVIDIGAVLTTDEFAASNTSTYYTPGAIYVNGSTAISGASYNNSDVIGIALNVDSNQVSYYKNGSLQQTVTINSGVTWAAMCGQGSGSQSQVYTINFGQRAFAYTAPNGFKALCDTNLGAPLVALPSTVFNVITYTGNGGTQTLPNANSTPSTPLGFSPDFVWFKSRTNPVSGFYHGLYDAVRGQVNGFYKALFSNSTDSEDAPAGVSSPGAVYGGVTAFNSNGFTVSAGSSDQWLNNNATPYVAWAWDAGTTTDPSNQAGSITSQVRANVSAGFSICTFTQPSSSSSFSWGHGLNVAPQLVFMKPTSSTGNWQVYHASTGAQYLWLNSTNAATGTGWSTVNSSIVTSTATLWAGNFATVAYCFAPVVGYSSFGSYTGNGSTSGDGPFVYLGFRPRFLMVKCSNNGTNTDWVIIDTARDTYNISGLGLRANLPSAEYDDRVIGAGYTSFDILSNGFKIKGSSGRVNASSDTYIYMAFAENPFQYARAR